MEPTPLAVQVRVTVVAGQTSTWPSSDDGEEDREKQSAPIKVCDIIYGIYNNENGQPRWRRTEGMTRAMKKGNKVIIKFILGMNYSKTIDTFGEVEDKIYNCKIIIMRPFKVKNGKQVTYFLMQLYYSKEVIAFGAP